MDDKVVSFGKGIHREPSLGAEGELTECVNMWSEGNEMKMLPRISHVRDIPDGWVSRFVHDSGNGWRHLILAKDGELGWVDFEGEGEPVTIPMALEDGEELVSITAMGNVLVVCSDSSMKYYLWSENEYKNYSFDELDNLDIQFALEGNLVTKTGSNLYLIKKTGTPSLFTEPIVMTNGNTILTVDSAQGQDTTINVASVNGNGELYGKTYHGKGVRMSFAGLDKTKPYMLKYSCTSADLGLHVLMFVHFKGKDYYLKQTVGTLHIDKGDSQEHTLTLYCDTYKYDYQKEYFGNASEVDEILFLYVTTTTDQCKGTAIISLNSVDNEVASATSSNIDYVLQREETNENVFIGDIDKFVKENSVGKNEFMYPFYLRYAIKLKDGNIIKPSSPVLMIPSTREAPDVYVTSDVESDTSIVGVTPIYSALIAKLQYKILNDEESLNKIRSRGEVIQSIVIGVTSPIYSYKQNITEEDKLKCMFCVKDNSESYGIMKIASRSADYAKYYKSALDNNILSNIKYRITIPSFTSDELVKKHEEASVFRIISEIEIKDTDLFSKKEAFADVPIDKDTLLGMEGRQMLTDNTASLKKYYSNSVYPYNSRLVLGNLREEYFNGYAPQIMTGYLTPNSRVNSRRYAVEIEIIKNNETRFVRKNALYENAAGVLYFYYPDADAKNITIYQQYITPSGGIVQVRSIALKKHPYLNGAYWFGFYEELPIVKEIDLTEFNWDDYADANISVSVGNKIISTFVNNPFTIDSESASLVGTGIIKKLVSNTKALSQGQFGQHPVLAFCTDGIWALTVNDVGKFMAVQPISRDVLTDAGKVVQLDDAVAFVSNRGLMLIDGSNVKKLCGQMDNIDAFDSSVVDEFISSALAMGHDRRNFVELLQTAELMYDGENGLIWIYPNENGNESDNENENENEGDGTVGRCVYAVSVNTGEVFAQVLDGRVSATGNTLPRGPESIVSGYPYSYVQYYTKAGRGRPAHHTLQRYKKELNEERTQGWLLTRPISFGDAYSMKMLYDMKVEKLMGEGSSCKVAVFVSNDRKHWSRLKSMKARSYKWYRFALFCTMNDYDRISGMICRIDKRRTNKIR